MGLLGSVGSVVGGALGGPVGAVAGGALGGVADGAISANMQASADKKAFQRQYAAQKEFAQHGIQWKVDDATRAGLHPLAALGAQTSSFSPVSVGGVDYSALNEQMGQNVDRAFAATRSAEDRAAIALERSQASQLNQINLERAKAGLQNDLIQNQMLASNLARLRSNQIGAPFPSGETSAISTGKSPRGYAYEVNKIPSPTQAGSALTAGTVPGMTKFNLGTDRHPYVLELPGQKIDEALDNVPGLGAYVFLRHQTARGVEYLQDRFPHFAEKVRYGGRVARRVFLKQ